ncbi:hypothetical protein ABIF44_008331 [Bradyrhizobium japonicum]|nr:porin [Bradyrhizobium japonicum]BAL12010.1 porin precursor [Bradyrhizobium japonicum USDA 6]KMJ97151.1 porin [Bradyrhizobium japonicum]MCS3538527.1 hypothetical protein [Bradyrhizobium japonicum]MCS3985386.1 hypothetical protein [Bradyrhizobium japonicum]
MFSKFTSDRKAGLIAPVTAEITKSSKPRPSSFLSPNACGNEVPLEVWYGWQATGWLNLKFDAQYVINPGGRGYNAVGVKTDNAVVLGMRTEVHF